VKVNFTALLAFVLKLVWRNDLKMIDSLSLGVDAAGQYPLVEDYLIVEEPLLEEAFEAYCGVDCE
jgi:hypothetical protein